MAKDYLDLMTLEAFKILNEVEQEELIIDEGVYLLNYVQGNYICDLYRIYNFYVKFCYHQDTEKDSTVRTLVDCVQFQQFFHEN